MSIPTWQPQTHCGLGEAPPRGGALVPLPGDECGAAFRQAAFMLPAPLALEPGSHLSVLAECAEPGGILHFVVAPAPAPDEETQ